MSQQKEIIDYAKSEFSSLVTDGGFYGPDVKDDGWMTRLLYTHHGELGIEIELDWREASAFALIVKLENGKMPNGYYTSNGRKCRKHLATVMLENGLLSEVSEKNNKNKNDPGKSRMYADINNVSGMLQSIDKIITLGDRIFV